MNVAEFTWNTIPRRHHHTDAHRVQNKVYWAMLEAQADIYALQMNSSSTVVRKCVKYGDLKKTWNKYLY